MPLAMGSATSASCWIETSAADASPLPAASLVVRNVEDMVAESGPRSELPDGALSAQGDAERLSVCCAAARKALLSERAREATAGLSNRPIGESHRRFRKLTRRYIHRTGEQSETSCSSPFFLSLGFSYQRKMSAGGSGAASLDELTLRKVNDFVDDDLLSCFLCAQPHASHPLRRFAHLSLLRIETESVF